MSTHKNIDRVCVFAMILALVLTTVFMNGASFGLQSADRVIGYENRLFDTSSVHTLDLVADDWDSFIESCESEEYIMCTAVIDGEKYKNVAIRAKGNTSLSSVSSLGSDRYSFKIEFDHYDSTQTYHGLDKLSLNNIIQDNTYMKDYLAYRMMDEFGVDAPLCSYVYITVNGEDWGLYLAVEGIEDAFLERNYGSTNAGELYKPDSMSFGGGRGNGMDFDMSYFTDQWSKDAESTEGSEGTENTEGTDTVPDANSSAAPGAAGTAASDTDASAASEKAGSSVPDANSSAAPGAAASSAQQETQTGEDSPSETGSAGASGLPEGFDASSLPEGFDASSLPEGFDASSIPGNVSGGFDFSAAGGGSFGSSSDVKLQYIDDDPDSYSNIFNNAKTDPSEEDKERLISSLKSLSSYEDLEDVLDTDEILRYFVVHNFTVNGDSYTGQMIHNYYLYEEDGKLSMIPWDYNLAYGSFMGGAASSSVNDAIDDVLSDRPMQAWIFSDETYTEEYHELYREFLETVDIQGIIDSAYSLIAEYVEKDPTKFCTYEEFETGVEALKSFCELRSESVEGQLDGTIPSTSTEQNTDSSALIDTGDLNLSDLGSMNSTGGGGGMQMPSGDFSFGDTPGMPSGGDTSNMPSGSFTPGDTSNMPSGSFTPGDTSNIPSGSFTPGDTSNMPSGSFTPGDTSNMPSGSFTPGDTSNMPSGSFTPGDTSNMPSGSFTPGDTSNMPSGSFTPGDTSGMPSGNIAANGESVQETFSSGEEETAVDGKETAEAISGTEKSAASETEAEETAGQNDMASQEFTRPDSSGAAGFPFGESVSGQVSGSLTQEQITLTAASLAVLAVGLMFAGLFRRRR